DSEVAQALPVALAARLRRSHLLFLGFGLRDWNLRLVLSRIWGADGPSYRSWAVLPGAPQLERVFWRARAIDLIALPLEEAPGTLVAELPELLRRSPRTNVLIAVREDSLAQLDAFTGGIVNVFANHLRLDHLDRDAAREAIRGPLERWRELTGEAVEIEPELVEALLDEARAGRTEGAARDTGDRIEAPFLQLVLERIWTHERAQGSS